MDNLKKSSDNDIKVNQTQSNSATFTNANSSAQNPIIISTQHPSRISIIHEVRNPQPQPSLADLTSPTASFYSGESNFQNGRSDGKVNMSYDGSNNDMRTPQPQQNRVFHQSYWSWQWPWSNWNQREKVFLLVIVILSLCILSLTSALSVVLQKNSECRVTLFDRIGLNV